MSAADFFDDAAVNNNANNNDTFHTNQQQFVAMYHVKSPDTVYRSFVTAEINLFSSRAIPYLFLYSCFAAVYNVAWYIGKMTQSKVLLGHAVAVVGALLYVVLAVGIGFGAVFMRHLAEIRIRYKMGQMT
eukprot:c2119_g1_i1.p1 GENE.c2119_g1_i1~~c2119_g1_i1.p1  ORF type:complete len:137 (-),score=37.57 c2119_g1_i1:232-621(-)